MTGRLMPPRAAAQTDTMGHALRGGQGAAMVPMPSPTLEEIAIRGSDTGAGMQVAAVKPSDQTQRGDTENEPSARWRI